MISDSSRIPLGNAPSGGPIQVFFAKPGSARKPRAVRGDGLYIWDNAGRRYIDVSSGPVANNLGHGNRRVLDAMRRQAEAVTFAFPTLFETEANVALADLLTSLAGPGLERAFFVSGGSEATESALKLCRQFALAKGEGKRYKVIGRDPGYHGATLGALAVTGDFQQHELFGPMLRDMPKIPAPLTYRMPDGHTRESYARHCAEALEARILSENPESVLAFIMEPIGGLATGALVAEDIYYPMVRDICSRHGISLIYDEVMSGAGRSGTFLAAEHWPEAGPDLVILAKGIAAGYTPMGCVLAPASMVQTVAEAGGFNHGYTYFANPLSCAVGHAVLSELVERDLMANAAARGEDLKARLEDIAADSAIVGDVRGRGLLLAVELVADKSTKRQLPLELVAPARFQAIAMNRGLAVYSRRTAAGRFGDWFMATPPLNISSDQVDEIADGLRLALTDFQDELARQGVLS